ncbi:hypothetical protein [Amycolatopsis thermoflava]|uniref:hypothetical protein n=1 Tax=Amycolatopsis thermoflava TaxID=84480 RepID=UPI003D75C4AD
MLCVGHLVQHQRRDEQAAGAVPGVLLLARVAEGDRAVLQGLGVVRSVSSSLRRTRKPLTRRSTMIRREVTV